jgi:hypothetical protein
MTNPLTDVLPAKARQIAYALLFVMALMFAAWQAADGDWLKALGLLVTSLLGAMAASNTPAPEGVDARH